MSVVAEVLAGEATFVAHFSTLNMRFIADSENREMVKYAEWARWAGPRGEGVKMARGGRGSRSGGKGSGGKGGKSSGGKNRSAITGRYISNAAAARHPRTSVTERS